MIDTSVATLHGTGKMRIDPPLLQPYVIHDIQVRKDACSPIREIIEYRLNLNTRFVHHKDAPPGHIEEEIKRRMHKFMYAEIQSRIDQLLCVVRYDQAQAVDLLEQLQERLQYGSTEG